MKKKTNQFQLKISLKGSKPLIWRRVIVDSNLLLKDIHSLIQVVMPWESCHLHQFIHNGDFYGPIKVEEDYFDLIDYSKIKLSDLIAFEKDKLVYLYDIGDNWEHVIVLEKILPATESKIRAEYVTGKNACPPEDCGGVYGYANILEILNDPTNAEYQDMRDWLDLEDDEEYDPKDIALDEKYIKNRLSKIK